jgi:hypothetical protein
MLWGKLVIKCPCKGLQGNLITNFPQSMRLVCKYMVAEGIARGVLVSFECCLIVLWLWDEHFSYIRTRRNTSPCSFFLGMRMNRIFSHNWNVQDCGIKTGKVIVRMCTGWCRQILSIVVPMIFGEVQLSNER